MENWQIALINETRRRQEQIAEAEINRMVRLANGQQPAWRRAYQAILLLLAALMIETGTRLQSRYARLAALPRPGQKPAPAPDIVN